MTVVFSPAVLLMNCACIIIFWTDLPRRRSRKVPESSRKHSRKLINIDMSIQTTFTSVLHVFLNALRSRKVPEGFRKQSRKYDLYECMNI